MLPLERNFALPRNAPYLRQHWAPFMRWARRGVADGNTYGGTGAARRRRRRRACGKRIGR